MAQLVTLQQAARNALAAWLTSELASEDVTVEPRWVESDRPLAPKHITVIDAGPRAIEWLDPEALKITNVDAENGVAVKKVDVVWGFGFITQPVQLDVWARSDIELDDIIARLDGSLNKGERGLGITNADPFRPGLLLHLLDGWAPGVVDFLFEEPVILQAPASVGEGEWRAMYRGRATAQLTQTARTARIARILLEQRIYVRDADLTAETEQTVIEGAALDSATLTLSGFWREYAGTPWEGTKSAGASEGRALTGNPAPAVNALNGLGIAVFDGTQALTSSLPVSSFLSASAWSIWCLVRVDVNDQFSLIDDPDEWFSLYVFGSVNGPGVAVSVWDSDAEAYVEATPSGLARGVWALVQARYDGATLSARVNGGAWASVASVPIEDLTNTLRVGAGLHGAVAEIGAANVALSDEQFDSVHASARERFALTA